MEAVDRLQQRPEVQLAIGRLSAAEQTHVQICLRVMSPRMKVPCVAVQAEEAEITLAPVEGQEGLTRLATVHSHRDLERPLRMVPLADALGELVEELLARDPAIIQTSSPGRRASDASASASAAAEPATAAGTEGADASAPTSDEPRLLLQALFDRAHRTPVILRTASGIEVLVDPHFHSGWLNRPLDQVPLTIADEVVTGFETVGLGTFQERIARGGGLHPLQVEQLCWLGSGTTGVATPLDRWLDQPDAVLRLQTWPNLSVQPDYAQWLQVLPAMWHGALTMEEAVRRLEATGMSVARARYGMALLCLFRHAKRDSSQVRPVSGAAPAPVAAPAAPAASTATQPDADDGSEKQGLLGRLKRRLRTMLG